jgi:hypothetical protein
MYHVHTVSQRKPHTFQHRLRQFCRTMLMRQTEKYALGLRIVMRRTFTGKIR